MKKITTLVAAIVLFPASVLFAQQTKLALAKPKPQHYTPLSQLQPGDYMANTMIVNVLPQYRSNCATNSISIPAVQAFLGNIGAVSVEKMFPLHKAPQSEFNRWGAPMIDISLIYVIKYNSSYELEKAIGKLYNTGVFEYVEPYFIPKAEFQPNDPQATSSSSYHIYKIVAASTSGTSAWDINTGSTTQVVGITDTGVELSHTDLTNQIAYNAADPINGSDDDNDGFIDNYRGWDVGMNDNDPTWQGNNHGVHVSGCASAQVNNNTGVAGSGYNCKFLPVKIADASGALTASYQGITYAADHGCTVINCSWGGTGGGSFGQQIIDYATNNQDALVVAAAGNNSADQAFYPAAFDRVLSVASTTNTTADIKSSFSNYNYTVDVSAPGSNINATLPGNSYGQNSGTSMASPVCAGAAALVRSMYPTYTAMQAGQRLRMTSDPHYTGSNALYIDKLGIGRINLYKAVTNPASTSVIYENKMATDNNDNAFVIGDTVRITGDFMNYLNPTSNLTATLTAVSGGTFITILDGTTNPGAIATLASANHTADPFTIKVNANAPANQVVVFRLTLTDGSWTVNQYFSETVNVDYINVTENLIGTSITSKGLIGYNMDQQQQGLGFTYNGSGSLLYEASLMIGKNSTTVSDMARGTTTPDVDFSSLATVHRVVPDVVSDFDLDGKFRDNIAPTPIPVTVHHQCYVWNAAPHDKYVIVQYTITNTGSQSQNNLYAGIFADWDIDATTYNDNRAGDDQTNRMGYVYHTASNGFYCGTKLLTSGPFVHYAIDNVNGGNGGADLYTNGYDAAEKYTTLSTNRPLAGYTTGTGNDVCDVVSTGPFNISPGDSITVAFALIAGDDLTDIQNSAVDAQTQYDNQVPLGIQQAQASAGSTLMQNFPNPVNGTTTIQYTLPQSGKADLRLYDVTGREVMVLATGEMNAGVNQVQLNTSKLPAGVYYYTLTTAQGKFSKKMMVNR